MICEACGGLAEEIGINRYRCKYCTHEFSVGTSYTQEQTQQSNRNDIIRNSEESNILTGAEIYEHAIKGVVEITATNNSKNGIACASGFVISETGFILTNAHAILDPYGKVYPIIQVKANDKYYKAMVVAIGKPADGKTNSIDLCLLFVNGLRVVPNAIGSVDSVKNGQKVYLIGNSLGSGTCITSGIISDKQRTMPGLSYPYIMTDAAANPGNSGGPLYNEHGEIIGVLVAGIDGAKGMNYAIPSNVVNTFMKQVVESFRNVKPEQIGLENYSSNGTAQKYSLSVAFTGLKILMDAIEFIVGLFKKK